MAVSQDPLKRTMKFSRLPSPVTIDGTTYGYALLAEHRGPTFPVVSGTVAGATFNTDGEGFAYWDVWFKRDTQKSHYTLTYGPGDSTEVATSHLMGGNIVTTPEWMRLHRYNNANRIAGGDHAIRMRPFDMPVFDWPVGSKKLRGECIDVTPHGTAPDEVNYNPETPEDYQQTSQQSDRQIRLGEYIADIKQGEQFHFSVDTMAALWQTHFTGNVKTGFVDSMDGQTDLTRVKFRPDTDAAETSPYAQSEEGYFPLTAQFPESLTFYFDEASWVFTFGHKLSDEDVASFYHNFFRHVITEGDGYKYEWNDRVNENTDTDIYLPLFLEGKGSGLDLSLANFTNVAAALEPWGEPLDCQIKIESAVGDTTGFGECGIAVVGNIDTPDDFFIAIDLKGGGSSVEVWEAKQIGGDTLKASFSPSYPFDLRIERTAGSDTFDISWRQSAGAWTALATITNMALGDNPKIGAYAADNSRIKWSQVEPGPSKTYYLHRPGLLTTDVAHFGMVDGIAGAPLNNDPVVFQLVADEPIQSVINQTANDTEMSDVATPKARDEYSFDDGDNTITIPITAAGDEVTVTLDAPESAPSAPGDYPPDQGIVNFSTDGEVVSENRANYHDLARIKFPADSNIPTTLEWPGINFTVYRNPVFSEVVSVKVDDAAETAGSWTTVPTSKWFQLPTDGIVLLEKDWIESNYSSTDEISCEVTAHEFQQTGNFDANAFNKAIECYDSLDNGWFFGGGGLGTPPEFIAGGGMVVVPENWKAEGITAIPSSLCIGNTSQTYWLNHPYIGTGLVDCDPPSPNGSANGWSPDLWPYNTGSEAYWRGWYGSEGFDGGTQTLATVGGNPVNICGWKQIGLPDSFPFTMKFKSDSTYSIGGLPIVEGLDIGAVFAKHPLYESIIRAEGIPIGLGERLSRWPDGTQIIEAFAEVSIPGAVSVVEQSMELRVGRVSDLSPNGQTLITNGARRARWEEWNGSAWVTTEDTNEAGGAADNRSFPLAFNLIGTRRHTRRLTTPSSSPVGFAYINSNNYVSLGGSIATTYENDQKSFLMDFTGIVQSLLDNRNSELAADGYFLFPATTSPPNEELAQGMGSAIFGGFPSVEVELLESSIDPTHEDVGASDDYYKTESFDDAYSLTFSEPPQILGIMMRARLPSGIIEDLRIPAKRPNLIVLG